MLAMCFYFPYASEILTKQLTDNKMTLKQLEWQLSTVKFNINKTRESIISSRGRRSTRSSSAYQTGNLTELRKKEKSLIARIGELKANEPVAA